MENTPYLYNTLVQVLGQHANWVDLRHLKTLAWMLVGLIHSGWINLLREKLCFTEAGRNNEVQTPGGERPQVIQMVTFRTRNTKGQAVHKAIDGTEFEGLNR